MNFNSFIFSSLQRFSVRLLTLVFLLGINFTASAAITVTIVKPVATGVVDRYPVPIYPVMTLVATVQSTYETTSVTGTLAGRSVVLTYSQSAYRCAMGMWCPAWIGNLDLTGVAQGTYELSMTAMDALGGSAVTTSSVTFDPPPTISVRKPVLYSVATPSVDLDLSCVDDVAGCTVSVKNAAGVEVLTGIGSAAGTVDLTQYIGQTTTLTVTVTDSATQTATKTLSIPVVDTARLVLQANVSGRIFDVAADRILYLDDTVEPQLLKIRNRATGADTTIYAVAGSKPIEGYLHPNGAMFIDQSGSVLTTQVYDWRNGSLVNVSSSYQSTGGFMVKGKYATYFSNANSADYFLRDLSTGANQLIATDIGNNTNSLTSSGSVAYWKMTPNGCTTCQLGYGYDIFLWKNSSSVQITHGGGLNVYPVTDDSNIVFKRKISSTTSTWTQQIILWNGSQEIVLADMGELDPNPPQNYAIANGYVAFTKPGTSGQLQVWRRLPSGTLEQLTYFSVGSQIDTISDTGTVTLTNGGKLYVYEVGGTLVELGAGLEKRFWLNSELYGFVGGSVFKIDRAAIPSPVTTTTTTSTSSTTSTSTSTSTLGTTTTTVATTTSTTLPSSSIAITLEQGWNLVGNAVDQILSVVSMFGDPVAVTSVWKWDSSNSGWQFYAPSMDAAALQTYATSKGYGVLSVINPGEGFWVNSNLKFNAPLPNGSLVSSITFQEGKPGALKPGWSLLAIGNPRSPSGFNGDLSAFPASVGVIPLNITSLWAWDNPLGKWYFYAPKLDGQGGTALTDYITSKAYLDFTANAKRLEAGAGFWVNKPQ